MNVRATSSNVVLVTIFIALLTTVIPILAEDYTVGVKTGDWIKYELNASWNGTGTESSPTTEMKQMSWSKVEIKNVSGTKVTLETITGYKNGTTEQPPNITIDVATGEFMEILTPANLKEGDSIPQQSGSVKKINGTITRTYCGASRNVNFAYITLVHETILSKTIKVYWDKATGIMVEFYLYSSATTSTAQQTFEFSQKATETNMWSADILGLISNNLIYIAGIVVLVVIITVSVFLLRRRKPTPTVTPTPTAVEEKPATPT